MGAGVRVRVPCTFAIPHVEKALGGLSSILPVSHTRVACKLSLPRNSCHTFLHCHHVQSAVLMMHVF